MQKLSRCFLIGMLVSGAFLSTSALEAQAPQIQVPGQSTRAQSLLPADISGPAPVRGVKSVGDYYIVGGERIDLQRAANEVVVRYKEGVDVKSAYDDLDLGMETVLVGSYKPSRIDIIDASNSKDKGTEKADAMAKALSNQSSVERTFPVYVYPGDKSRMIITDEVLICLEPGTDGTTFQSLLNKFGGEVIEKTLASDVDIYLVQFADEDDVLGLTRDLSDLEIVDWAEPNFIREFRKFFTPADPLFQYQQTLHNPGGDGRVADADVDAPEAWDISQGSSSIIVAVIDDGVDTTHPEMNIAPGGYDFYDDDSDPNPAGSNGHGTGCAGIVAGIGNSTGMTGIARNCRILPIKISEDQFATDVVIGNAIRYAADRADVLSNSWGGGSPTSNINSAIDYSLASGRGGLGAPVFFASGNSASGFDRGGGRIRLSSTGLSGNYFVGFYYEKDSSVSEGLDAVLIDNFCTIGSDQYTTQNNRQDFEGSTFPPSGWTQDGDANWLIDTTNANTGTGGTRSARSGDIGDDQYTVLVTPLLAFTGAESIAFSAYLSTEGGYDNFYVDIYDSTGSFVGSFGPMGGVPDIITSTAYPASYANTIAVGTATDRDYRSAYSQYGPELDFLAPSNGGWHDVVSLDPVGEVGWNDTSYKYNFGGTSSACPLAAGIAALALSVDQNLTHGQVRTLMRESCDKVGPLSYTGGIAGAGGRNDQYGYGRINARSVLDNLPTSSTPSSDPGVVLETLNATQWRTDYPDGVFDSPNFQDNQGLGLQVSNPTNTFGYWETREFLNPLPAGLHRIRFDIDGVRGGANKRYPEVRFRVFRNDFKVTKMTVIGETVYGNGYPDYVDVYWESDGVTPWRVAVDLLSFQSDLAGGVIVGDINVTQP